MKKMNMKNGFTMIELIFVIVVLGILASVAMPKFASVQSDAKVASEKATMGSVRNAIGMLHGKAIIKDKAFKMKISSPEVTTKSAALLVSISDEMYPLSLSLIGSTTGETSKEGDSVDNVKTTGANIYKPTSLASDGSVDWADDKTNGKATMGVTLEYEGRAAFKTGAPEDAAANDATYASGSTYYKQLIEGPASKAGGITDDNANVDEFEIDADGAWQYDAITGTVVYRIDADNDLTSSDPLTYTSDTN